MQDAAGQLRKSPYQFSGIGSQSPLLWLIRGYAVLDGPTMPIVAGSEDAEPNDTYVPQLVASAKAAVEVRLFTTPGMKDMQSAVTSAAITTCMQAIRK